MPRDPLLWSTDHVIQVFAYPSPLTVLPGTVLTHYASTSIQYLISSRKGRAKGFISNILLKHLTGVRRSKREEGNRVI